MIETEKNNKHMTLEDRIEIQECLSNFIYPRRKYYSKTAQQEYKTTLKESREGIPLTKEGLYANERIISEAVKNGQHIYHAIIANKLAVSKTTEYRSAFLLL